MGGEDTTPVIFLFLRSLKSYVTQFQSETVYCTWDKKLEWPSTNFRFTADNVDYKGTRDHKEFDDLHKHNEDIFTLLENLGVRNIFPKVMEADDVIAWLVHTLEDQFTIVSGDHDLWQLVSDKCQVFEPRKRIVVTKDNFTSYSDVPQSEFIRYKCLVGDKSDNIEGIPKVGLKRAKKILESWPDSYNKLSKEHKAIVDINEKLVDLSYGYTVHEGEIECYESQLRQLRDIKMDMKAFKERCEKLGFNTIIDRVSDWRNAFSNKRVNQTIMNLIGRLGLNK
tara:strand:+ start:5724 stop:6566 length:843 start_codon:yes stop_codon:yes gene_type:complete